MIKVAVLDDYLDVVEEVADWSRLRETAKVAFFTDHLADEDAIVERLRDVDIVVGMRERTPFPRSLLARLPKLALLITLGMNNKSFDLEAATELGIAVSGTGGQGSDPIELTWGLILAIARAIPQEDRATRDGAWQVSLGGRLAGKTLGLVGLGRIGSEVARIGNAFRMNVVAWSQNLTEEKARACGATRVPLESLLATADIVSLHLRLSPRTERIIGASELAAMKPGAFLVNTARSGLLDEPALIETLRQKRIAGAALDVFDEEPLPAGHPLRQLPNTVITPHLGGVTRERYSEDYNETIDDILAFLASKPVRLLNPAVMERPNLRRHQPKQ
jgi:phosphoglycerate dehydrogenase-like enzyme